MKKGYVFLILTVCFMLGFTYGMNSKEKNVVSARVNQVSEQIQEYETQISNPDSKFVPLSLQTQELSEKEVSDSLSGISHNNISKFGQDAGEMIKSGVREMLRYVVRFCDQLISE